jgi:hypothetical protein
MDLKLRQRHLRPVPMIGFKELLLWKWKSEAMNICAMKTRLSEAMELVSYQRGRNKGKQKLRK